LYHKELARLEPNLAELEKALLVQHAKKRDIPFLTVRLNFDNAALVI